jgi:hypothetical protein
MEDRLKADSHCLNHNTGSFTQKSGSLTGVTAAVSAAAASLSSCGTAPNRSISLLLAASCASNSKIASSLDMMWPGRCIGKYNQIATTARVDRSLRKVLSIVHETGNRIYFIYMYCIY